MADALRLYGLNAVVMAGASGIGEATTRTLVKHGAIVVALDTEASGVETVYKSVRGATGLSFNSAADDIGGAAVTAATESLGVIDIVVNYVELPQIAPITNDDASALEKLLHARETHFQSMTTASLPYLKRSPAGRIVNIGFVRSVFAVDGEKAYEKSHAALAQLSQSVAAANGEYGISANYIQPGAIMTPESRRVYAADLDLRDYCIQRSAAGRLGETVDIAKVVLFLTTDDASFVNGTGVVADGGRANTN